MKKKEAMNRAFVDAFTPSHFAGGMVARGITKSRVLGWGIIILYELLERPLLGTLAETKLNQVGDIVASISGWEFLNWSYERQPGVIDLKTRESEGETK